MKNPPTLLRDIDRLPMILNCLLLYYIHLHDLCYKSLLLMYTFHYDIVMSLYILSLYVIRCMSFSYRVYIVDGLGGVWSQFLSDAAGGNEKTVLLSVIGLQHSYERL